MATQEDENPTKRPKVSHEEDAVIDLEDSEDGHLEEDVKLENQLRDAQADLDKIHEEMLTKLREVEHEYENKKAPFYAARADVIKNIPGFWLHCFLQHQEIRHIIGEVDEQILSSLLEIAVKPHKDPKHGYNLAFRFADNAWFEDEVLTKQINFETDNDSGSPTCQTTGSKPKWKKQDPTVTDGEERGGDAAPFVSWLVSERTLEPGLVDTLADIIKDQLYVNPLEYLEADHGSEGQEEDLLEEGDEEEEDADLEAVPEEDAEATGNIEGGPEISGDEEDPLDYEEDDIEQDAGDEEGAEGEEFGEGELEGEEEEDLGEEEEGDEEDVEEEPAEGEQEG